MFEVEAKIRITFSEFSELLNRLADPSRKSNTLFFDDQYFGDWRKNYLRIRWSADGHSLLSLKKKQSKEGLETNLEMEWDIKNPRKLTAYLKKIRAPETWKKKNSIRFRHGRFWIELNRVAGLGFFLEIETQVPSEARIPSVRTALIRLFEQLGFSPDRFEKKYYLELLSEKEKNR